MGVWVWVPLTPMLTHFSFSLFLSLSLPTPISPRPSLSSLALFFLPSAHLARGGWREKKGVGVVARCLLLVSVHGVYMLHRVDGASLSPSRGVVAVSALEGMYAWDDGGRCYRMALERVGMRVVCVCMCVVVEWRGSGEVWGGALTVGFIHRGLHLAHLAPPPLHACACRHHHQLPG